MDEDRFYILKTLAPYLAATVAAAVLCTVLVLRHIPGAGQPPTVVSFDVVKFTNAQRAVASAFLRPDQDFSAANQALYQLPSRTRDAIAEVAGEGALVVVKQAVVQGQTRDITDDVLRVLGLPTDVPTSDGVSYQLDVAPTILFQPPAERKPAPMPGEGRDPSGKVLP